MEPLRWPSGYSYEEPVAEYADAAKAKAIPNAKALGKLGIPKVPPKYSEMTLGKGSAKVKAPSKAKAKVTW